ncbi:hypothetical protein BGZ61DRAFT_575095 [Ilyonectria robusta]|uniref:uncharacterized protein n=1 Tax=Ilyonectria robusta TaxID=1079257 RepID=UPI001E8D3C01|nr:uncharacterized protein BGZ61DRAFT_575095 [Ilyonectria robusta]KAH8652902.1 hypothetical protein BGZ61DRAFT_575095 [Ilyonectria robusta]
MEIEMESRNDIHLDLPYTDDAIFAPEDKSYMDLLEFFDASDKESEVQGQLNRSRRIQSKHDLETHMRNDSFVRRIAIVYQPFSWAPLDVSKSMIHRLLTLANAMRDVWDIVLSFRAQNTEVEEAFSPCSWRRHRAMRETSYIFKYPERKALGKGNVTWVIRQIGLYHQYSLESEKNTWLLIFPNRQSYSLDRVTEIMDLDEHPLQPHLCWQSAHIQNWRWYMVDLEKEFHELAMDILNVEIEETLDFKTTYDQLSSLRYIETRLSPLEPILSSYERVFNELGFSNAELRERRRISEESANEFSATLRNLLIQNQALMSNVKHLLSRVHSTIQAASGTISLKSQNTTEQMSNHMLGDSASIRVITAVTLVYLPASFVSGFFGMSFFDARDDSGWSVVPSVWIYFLVAIPMSVLTLMYWKWRSQRCLRMNVDVLPV